jgi:hypothetical protein
VPTWLAICVGIAVLVAVGIGIYAMVHVSKPMPGVGEGSTVTTNPLVCDAVATKNKIKTFYQNDAQNGDAMFIHSSTRISSGGREGCTVLYTPTSSGTIGTTGTVPFYFSKNDNGSWNPTAMGEFTASKYPTASPEAKQAANNEQSVVDCNSPHIQTSAIEHYNNSGPPRRI